MIITVFRDGLSKLLKCMNQFLVGYVCAVNDIICFAFIINFIFFTNTWLRLVFQQTEESQEAHPPTHARTHHTCKKYCKIATDTQIHKTDTHENTDF